MAISRSLLSMMDGAIEVESEPGRGTRFLLRLPLIECDQSQQPADGTTADPPVQRRLAGLRILAMEDQELNRIVLEDLLLFEGAEVVFAENGRVGLDRLRAEGIDAFDLVLTDLHMPVMDGLEATRQLRAMAPALPVIGVTADAMEEERRRCKEIGMCDYVTKPIDSEQLVAAILRQFPGGAGGA